MSDPKEIKNEDKTKDTELSDEQLNAASGGVPTSKWKGEAQKKQDIAD